MQIHQSNQPYPSPTCLSVTLSIDCSGNRWYIIRIEYRNGMTPQNLLVFLGNHSFFLNELLYPMITKFRVQCVLSLMLINALVSFFLISCFSGVDNLRTENHLLFMLPPCSFIFFCLYEVKLARNILVQTIQENIFRESHLVM